MVTGTVVDTIGPDDAGWGVDATCNMRLPAPRLCGSSRRRTGGRRRGWALAIAPSDVAYDRPFADVGEETGSMCTRVEGGDRGMSRRTLMAAAIAAGGAMVPAGAAWAGRPPGSARVALGATPRVVETVLGPVGAGKVRWALAHEHFFVDFSGPTRRDYMDVDWSDVTGACVNSARTLRAQGVDLVVDWTNMGVGRNVLLLRDIARQTGVSIVCPTGIYKSLIPPELRGEGVGAIARHFHRELTRGIDGTRVRAGWVKCATTEAGPTATDTRIHRAAARAAKAAGCTLSLHSPHYEATLAVVATLEREGFDLRRFVWGHSQVSSVEQHIALARRGAMVQYDAISANQDAFFAGPTDDDSMLDRIEEMVEAGFGHRVVVSADASVFVNPARFQYDRDNSYVMRTFVPKLRRRLGADATRMVLRDNVLAAFRRGDRVPKRAPASTSARSSLPG
jgi:predicted metal-dependent phosphotriesterase family hydrolase